MKSTSPAKTKAKRVDEVQPEYSFDYAKAKPNRFAARKRASLEDRSLTVAAPIRAPTVREGLPRVPNHAAVALVERAAPSVRADDLFVVGDDDA